MHNIDITPVMDASVKVKPRVQKDVFPNLIEEVGEFVKAINRPDEVDEDAFGEGADVIICVLDSLRLLAVDRYPQIEGESVKSYNHRINTMVAFDLETQLNKKSSKWVEKD